MDIRQLKTFLAVAEHLNFTRAAEELHLAQSSVSAQIRLLEQDLEVRLFDRLGRRVLLTAAGERLYGYARRMEEMTREIRSELAGAEDTRGSLTVRVPESLAELYMPEVVERFHKARPGAGLRFINCSDTRLREELNSGRIDLAFLMADDVYLREVNQRLLRIEPLILAAAPGHDLARRASVTPQDLHGRTLLLSRTD